MEFEENIEQNTTSLAADSFLESKSYFQKFKQFIKALNDSNSKLDNAYFNGMASNLRVSIPMITDVQELETLYLKIFSNIP